MSAYEAGNKPGDRYPTSSLIQMANRSMDVPMSTDGLVIDGIYHLESLIRPYSEVESAISNPQVPQQYRQQLPDRDQFRLPGVRIPRSEGWHSPEAPPAEEAR